MKSFFGCTLLLVALGLAGCGSGTATVVTPPDQGGATAKSPTPAPETNQAKSVVPDSLMTEAYHWYGLGNTQPMKMEVNLSDGRSFNGTQTITLRSVEGGKAIYDVKRADGLATVFGDETVSLEKDGVYTVSSTKLKGDTRNIEMPSKLPVGATWTNAGKLETTDDQSMQPNQTYTVARQETVNTKAGSATALLIVSNGNSILGGKKFRMETRNWYVKDKGLVKAEIRLLDMANKKAKPQVITIQEIK